MSRITELVWQLAEPVAARHGCEIWDVEFVKEAGARFLRVYIDREDGVDIDLCEAVSRELDPLLDEADPIQEAYTFEVSSAGAERELKRPGDFERFMGSTVAVKLYSARGGRKEHVGTLTGWSPEAVELEENGKTEKFAASEVAQVRLRILFGSITNFVGFRIPLVIPTTHIE